MLTRSLWWRLFLAYLWVPVIVLLALGLYGSQVVRNLFEQHVYADLEARARLAGKPVEELLANHQADKVDAVCKELGQATQTRITVILPDGKVIGDSNETPENMDRHHTRPEVLEALAGKPGRATRFSSTEQEERIYLAVPLRRGELNVAVVRTSLPMTALTTTLSHVRGQILVGALIGAAFYALISVIISRRMSRPLEQIKTGARRFAAGDLDHRLPVTGAEEIRAVAETMNAMAEQLDERIRTVLRQQHEHEVMLSSMEEGVLAVDNEGRILSLNRTCAHLLGGEPEKFRGRTVYEMIRNPELLALVESALTNESTIDSEIEFRGPQDHWLTGHGTTLQDSERGTIGVLIVLHDVTRLRHLEEVRRDFVANVSHELRTPITSIKGFVETLLDGALEDTANAVRFLQIMARQVNRLDAIINDLLALSRIERSSDGQLVELAQESIRGVLLAAAEMCERKAHGRDIQVTIECPIELTAEINAALLEQAVVNLLDNAITYSEPGKRVEITAHCEDAAVVIRVKDEGCGIEARHLPRLFERFYRVDKARSRELGGTGLGLAIVRHIALAHRGEVSVESNVGLGSVFTLRVPASRASA